MRRLILGAAVGLIALLSVAATCFEGEGSYGGTAALYADTTDGETFTLVIEDFPLKKVPGGNTFITVERAWVKGALTCPDPAYCWFVGPFTEQEVDMTLRARLPDGTWTTIGELESLGESEIVLGIDVLDGEGIADIAFFCPLPQKTQYCWHGIAPLYVEAEEKIISTPVSATPSGFEGR